MYKRIFSFVAMLMITFASVMAQVTTSSMSGKVVAGGEDVIGATITAVHEPSGTRYNAVTNENGRFTIQGMRVGGPYKVTVNYIGYKDEVLNNIQLSLGQTRTVNVDLKEDAQQLGEVTVTGKNGRNSGGAAANFNQQRIENTPTISRDIYDVAKLSTLVSTSRVGGISISGINNRYNSFQIDGTVSNDVFGLASSGTNGGQTGANPISMDAIQELQVSVAPFDVRQSGFTGGAINAITKSGTNQFHGSAYMYYTNQDMYSKYNRLHDYAEEKLSERSTKTYGATFGGPIVKDKLFFFTSAEYKKTEAPATIYPGYISSYVTESSLQQIADKYKSLTGFEDSYGKGTLGTKAFSFLARLDWNIDNNNHLAFRYQHNDSYDDKDGLSSNTFTFNNSSYRMNNKTNSFVAELNSHISPVLYNEARVSASFIRDNRNVGYQGPTVQISNVLGGDGTSNNTVNIGTEFSSGANYLNQDIWSIEDNLSWYLGNHNLTFGIHDEFYKMKNLFIQASNGAWYYNSLEDFLADNPWKYTYKYTDPELTGGDTRWTPNMKYGLFGFYAQDKWDITPLLNLTYGIRFDINDTFNNPTTNEEFNSFAAEHNLGVEVGKMPSAKLLVSPRVGFNWYTDDSRRTLLRGGIGIFSGRAPYVWLSNAFVNNGVEAKGTTITKNVPTLTQYAKDPLGAASQSTAGLSPDIVTISKNFKFPQVLRMNLALEQTLPGDVKMTLEGLYSKNMNNVFFENLAYKDNGDKVYAVEGVDASAVTSYSKIENKLPYYSIINLRNTSKGYSYNFSVKAEKTFDFGLYLMASYIFGHSYSVNDGTSSVAYSNWKYNYSRNTNDQNELSWSKFDIPHQVRIQVAYQSPKYWNGWMSTDVAINYNGFSGGRYSLTMNEKADYNNDGWRGNSLLYIPTKEELAQMQFTDTKKLTAEQSRQMFEEWIENDDYAKNHRGQYAKRNSNMTPWENEINLHVAQNIYNIKGIGKMQLTFDVMNFANMLNKHWGAHYSNAYNLSPLTLTAVKNGVGYFQYNTNSKPVASDVASRWHAQVGLRLEF
ncbi:TonB-dependent receptor [Prevotella sp. AGR2160]|uniref:TonB-dependent receptor n=1 Tax=Prevotella sp. AGR2160 TaxID=1280674 RepID=UPI00048FF137|nr:TonB-dependent receptor [Prevotella sp. AGR2160]